MTFHRFAPEISRYLDAVHVAIERLKVVGGIAWAADVAGKRECSVGRVPATDTIIDKRTYSSGRIIRATCVEQQRRSASGRIAVAGVKVQRSCTDTRVEVAGGHAKQRRVPTAVFPTPVVSALRALSPSAVVTLG